MGAPQSVTVFNTQTGAVVQTYKPFNTKNGSSTGIAYTPNGLNLLFSQDSSYVAIASVDPVAGTLTDFDHVSVPMDVNAGGYLTTVTCFPNSPPGTTGSVAIPCGQTISLFRMARIPPIPPASRSRRMARLLTSCWITTTR